jgi:CxxC motif-containing protein
MVSVKTAQPVPKGAIFEVMALIRNTTVQAPVKIGDVIIDDVYGTQVIATKNID